MSEVLKGEREGFGLGFVGRFGRACADTWWCRVSAEIGH